MGSETQYRVFSTGNELAIYGGCSGRCLFCPQSCSDVHADLYIDEHLEDALRKKRRLCMVGIGRQYDPYMAQEEKLRLTRNCLRVISETSHGVYIRTRSEMIVRDIDLLKKIHSSAKAVVLMGLSCFDDNLCEILEPGQCSTSVRYEVMGELHRAGIPVIAELGPFVPWANDTVPNLNGLLGYCARAGVRGVMCGDFKVNVPDQISKRFFESMERAIPGFTRQARALIGNTSVLRCPDADALEKAFRDGCLMYNLSCDYEENLRFATTYPEKQLSFFFD
ncbi:MAG: hypothetical protein J5785_06820 [Spirochaetales bacterium]|nr:hypothetical protein [Spirochaetales bacterium]